MLKLLQALFGKKTVEAEVAQPKALEFHEEIRAQVEAEKAKLVKEMKPAVKAKTAKAKKAPAKIKAEPKKAPAKKTAPKKSK